MVKGDGESSGEEKLPRRCVYKGCNQTVGLKKSKTGNWYCVAHHPELREKHKAGARKAQKAGARTKRERRDALLLSLDIQPNKASILQALVQQANYLAKDIGPRELRRHHLVIELMDRIYEYATEEGDDAQKQQKVVAIMESDLPNELKLSKLTDVVGPQKACEMIKVEVKRNAYEDKVLDGEALLKGQGGESISKPQTFDLKESDSTEDLPEVEEGLVQQVPGGPVTPPGQAALPGAPPPPPVPPPPASPPETTDEKERRCVREARELMGLYRAKCPTSPTPLESIAQIFYQGLMDGCPFKDLQARCMFPKSDTDQPNMMVRDVLAAKKKSGAG